MRQNYKLQRFNRVVIALAILVLLTGGIFSAVKFLAPASEPVSATEREYVASSNYHYYSGTSLDIPNSYCYIYVSCDDLGVSSITGPDLLRYSNSYQNSDPIPVSSIHSSIYWYPTSLNLTINLIGYSWVNTATSFSAKWAISYYDRGTSLETALSNAKHNLNNSRMSATITYTRSDNNFTTSSKLTDVELYGNFRTDHNKYPYVVLYIDFEKPASSVQRDSYTLSFDSNGGNTISNRITTYYNSTIGSSLPTPQRDSYIFNGWYIGNTHITSGTTWSWTSDQIAQARWIFDGYTLSYNVNNDVGGSIVGASTEYLKNTSVVVTASPDNNYVFSHWVLNGETLTLNPLTFTITQNSTLTAYFTKLPEVTSSTNGSEFATFSTEALDLSYRYNITFTTDNYLYSATVNTGAEQRIASMNGMLTVPDNSCTAIIYYTNETGSRLFLEIIGVTGDVTINLTFSNVSQSFSPTSGGGASGIVVSATEGGVASVVGDDFENLADDDEILYIAKLSMNGYQFSHWEDAEGNILGYTDNLLLIKAEAYNTKVIAVFIPTNQENTNSTTDTQPTDTPEII